MRSEDADRLAALDEQRLVVAQAEERSHDRLQRVVTPRGAAAAAVDDERLGMLGDLRVEVVEQHPERSLCRPRARVEVGAPRRTDPREISAERLDRGLCRLGGRHRSSVSSCSRPILMALRNPSCESDVYHRTPIIAANITRAP
jgi:hypothetical protein